MYLTVYSCTDTSVNNFLIFFISGGTRALHNFIGVSLGKFTALVTVRHYELSKLCLQET